MANRVKISLTSDDDSIQSVRGMLPQVGYGQAQVVASPLRMATVAAAVADDGLLRAPYVDSREQDASGGAGVESLVEPAIARRLASYMRDVVTSGTGRGLRNHQTAIAGKTGTAELSARPSHSWFVGFAPYGPVRSGAKKRIAFAVIIENAGYGGVAAAPAAGEIVAAAADTGLIGK
jgi:cell division protein FtsI/penicillin-binding protein 2